MSKLIRILLALVAMLLSVGAFAEGEATWSAKLERTDVRAGEVVKIVVSAVIKPGWHGYSIVAVPEGPFPTTVTPPSAPWLESAGPVTEIAPKKELDPNFQKVVGIFENSAELYVPIKVKEGTKGSQKLSLRVRFEVCNAQMCLPPKNVDLTLDVPIADGAARPEFAAQSGAPITDTAPINSSDTTKALKQKEEEGLGSFILFAFLAGLATLLTPCVFPMIPVTVSYFTKQQRDDGKLNLAGPVAYCLGIIGTFTILGVVFSAAGVRWFATNVWVNMAFALLFIILAASLFGVFELRLPGWLVNKASKKSRTGGVVGAVFTGLTFTLTSFTCTVPVVGALLTGSTGGGKLYPVVGMLSYGTAFALPFFLLALFPAALSKLPRSGAWMVTVKAFMGFLELMAALKFVSNVDLAFSLGYLTRPVFLAIWAAIAAVAGFFLLGWLRLPHDSGDKPGVLRRLFGLTSLAGAVWFLAAMNGVSLKQFAGFMPPDPYPSKAGSQDVVSDSDWIPNYEQALAKAKTTGKNVFIDFTGVYCTNCRAIEETVFSKPEIKDLFKNFVLAKLFTDRGTPDDDANQALEKKFTGSEALPIYVVVSPDGKVLKVHEQQVPIDDAQQFLTAINPFVGKGS